MEAEMKQAEGEYRTGGILLPALRLVRNFRDMDKQELSRRSGVARRTITAIEAGGGARRPTVTKLATALEVQESTLFRDWKHAVLEEEEDATG